jgi:hypothetical protein
MVNYGTHISVDPPRFDTNLAKKGHMLNIYILYLYMYAYIYTVVNHYQETKSVNIYIYWLYIYIACILIVWPSREQWAASISCNLYVNASSLDAQWSHTSQLCNGLANCV